MKLKVRMVTAQVVTILAAILLLAGALVPAKSVARAVGDTTDAARAVVGATGAMEVHYFNDDLQNDGDETNDFRFGPNRYFAAKRSDASSVQAYIANKDGTGDFFDSIRVDPALLAAVALDMDESLDYEEKILVDEQDVRVQDRANAAHLHFLRDDAYRARTIELVEERLTSGTTTISALETYTSSMYMAPQGLEGNKPSVIVRRAEFAGGHFVEFNLGERGTVRFRLECGYQPVDMTYWQPPAGKPPAVDNPPDSGNPPDTPSTPPDKPDNPLEPKDPNAGPQAQGQGQPGYEDFGGGPNYEPNTTVTAEPQAPSSYSSPSPPSGGSGGGSSSPTPGPSGSYTVDQTNGTTETYGGQDYTVVSGDGQNHSDLQEVQENHDSTTVEPALQGDGTNSGDLDPSAVE